MNPKISIILPIYKVEKYITKCVATCCSQDGVDYNQFELILVDDSTPDNSIQVAEKELANYPSVHYKVVHRKNGGLSAARNTGIESAIGEYLWFVDSDDYVNENALQVLFSYLANEKYDIIRFRHSTIYKNGNMQDGEIGSMKPIECTGYELLKRHGFLSVCGGIYKRSFVNEHSLRFKEDRIWEDSEFNLRAYSLARKCLEIGNAFYYYIRREESISDCKATPHSTASRLKNVDDLMAFFEKETDKEHLSILSNHICGTVIAAIAGFKEMGNEALKPFRKEIKAKRNHYLSWAKYAKNKRAYVLFYAYGFMPTMVEAILSKRMYSAIKRSQQLQSR